MNTSFFENIKDYHDSSLWKAINFALLIIAFINLGMFGIPYIYITSVSFPFKLFIMFNIAVSVYVGCLLITEYRNNRRALHAILEYMKNEPYSNFKMMKASTWNGILTEDEKMYIMKKSYNTCKQFDEYIERQLK